jgi:CubicO group peptidase (beta-lactamase class C family)
MVAGIGLLTVARSQSQSTDAVDTPAPLAAPAPTSAKPATTETAAPATPSPIAPIPAVQLEAFVDGLVAEARTRDHIAGVAVTVVQNGQVVLRKGYGFAGPGRAVDPERTLFRLGGITSTFTWIALMKEAEAGHIRLDAPANLVLPEKLRIHDQGFHRQVLMRDLMNHSAGFEDRTLGQLFERDPGNVRPLDDYLLQERPRRVREPGDLPSYSYYGAALAGAALSYFDTRPYQTVIESEILKPLGLSHTSLREPYPARADLPAPMASALSSEVSVGYLWRGGEFQPQGFEFSTQLAPAMAASSTADDMARYVNLILAGGQLDGVTLYGPVTAKAFRTTALAGAPGVDGWDDGFKEFSLPGGYRGQGQLGDTQWFHSSLVTVPALNLGMFVATNTDTGARLAASLPGQIVQRFYAAAPLEPRSGSPDLSNNADDYTGVYLTTRRPYGGLGKFVAMLTGEMRVSVTPDGRLLTKGARQTQTWTAAGAPGRLQAVEGPQVSAFALDGGQATRWFAPSGAEAFDRIGWFVQAPTLAALAVLTALASIATLLGQFTRDRRESRQTAAQSRANLLQTTVAVLWLIVFVAFGVWSVHALDPGQLMYHWPGPGLLVASACAFVAAILTALTVLLAPLTWRGGRRLDSWSGWRKLSFTFTTLVFATFSVVLGLWGALEPWSR